MHAPISPSDIMSAIDGLNSVPKQDLIFEGVTLNSVNKKGDVIGTSNETVFVNIDNQYGKIDLLLGESRPDAMPNMLFMYKSK